MELNSIIELGIDNLQLALLMRRSVGLTKNQLKRAVQKEIRKRINDYLNSEQVLIDVYNEIISSAARLQIAKERIKYNNFDLFYRLYEYSLASKISRICYVKTSWRFSFINTNHNLTTYYTDSKTKKTKIIEIQLIDNKLHKRIYDYVKKKLEETENN